MDDPLLTRRAFCGAAVVTALAPRATPKPTFKLNYSLGSCMYGRLPLSEILPQVKATGTTNIDIWPAPHGNQREQVSSMGREAFAALLKRHRVRLGILTRYDRGPFRLQEEMRFARTFGCSLVICGAKGPRGLKSKKLKSAIRSFLEQMRPHLAVAEEAGVTVGIENHAASLIESPDSMRYLAELAPSKNIGIALAPYHLPQDPALIARLIKDLGNRLVHFYAWQHGAGCHTKMPKEKELLQMPGRGPLDFAPIIAALETIAYRRWTEIFMHPYPRGIPILSTPAAVTAEINRARRYLEGSAGKAIGTR